MGATADRVSYEASRFGQGVLTYSLPRGMRGEPLHEGGRLDVRKSNSVSEDLLVQIARAIGSALGRIAAQK